MLVLSENKSAYSTLKALVAQLNQDVENLKVERDRESKRSHSYINLTGQIGGINSTISLIMITDVWHNGEYQERKAAEDAAAGVPKTA